MRRSILQLLSKPALLLIAVTVCLTQSTTADAAVINYTDLATYNAAVGPHTIITFQEFPPGTVLDTEYLPLGVTFDGTDMILASPALITDGVGDRGNGRIELLFSSYQTHIGAEFPGALTIQIFDGATLVGTSQNFAGSGTGFFGGILSDVPFNRAILTDWVDDFVLIDNLHFGTTQVVPEPTTLALCGLIGVGLAGYGWRRRKAMIA